MDASVFSFRNNSNEVQEFSVFESSSLSGANSNLTVVWNFEANYSDIYSPVVDPWYNAKITNSPGAFAIRLFRTDGSTFIESTSLPNDPALTTLSTIEFQDFLNRGGFGDIGVWELLGPTTGGNEEIGAIQTFWNIRCTPSQAFIDANDISTDPKFNYGVQSISLSGGNGIVNWNQITVRPSAVAVAPALVSNPNISVVSNSNFSYSDFLWSTIQRTYDIKNFQIYSLSQQQILEPFLFDRTLATGKVYQKVLTPTIDPYQSQNYIITPDGKGYILDGFTKIKYTLLPLTTVRLILDYTYIDISTPLIAKLVAKPLIQHLSEPLSEPLTQYIATSPGNYAPAPLPEAFINNMEDGYERFGCKFLAARLVVQQEKLEFLKSKPPGKRNPKWQQFLNDKITYITKKLTKQECDVPDFEVKGDEFIRRNLWMPSPEFVQHQLDTEQGARKLFGKHDFPIEKE